MENLNMPSKKVKNPIDRFVYSVRDSFKNIRKAFAESEVVHKVVNKIIPSTSNEYSSAIAKCALEIVEMMESHGISSSDKNFNLYYKVAQKMQPEMGNDDLILGYVTSLVMDAMGIKNANKTNMEIAEDVLDLLHKSDRDLTAKEKEALKKVLSQVKELRSNITIDE